jgi:hypothetical protein
MTTSQNLTPDTKVEIMLIDDGYYGAADVTLGSLDAYLDLLAINDQLLLALNDGLGRHEWVPTEPLEARSVTVDVCINGWVTCGGKITLARVVELAADRGGAADALAAAAAELLDSLPAERRQS